MNNTQDTGGAADATDHREFTREVARRLCVAFGVDPVGVREVTLRLSVDGVPTITVVTHGGMRNMAWDYAAAAAVLFAPAATEAAGS